MVLSDKYEIKEDKYNIMLSQKTIITKTGRASSDNVGKYKWTIIGHYPPTARGREQVYRKVINLEISDHEKQTLQEILNTLDKVGGEIKELFKK